MTFSIKTVGQLRDHLRSLRKAAGLTQKQLGMRLGLGQVRVAEIEANPGSISTEQLLSILQALDAELIVQHKQSPLTVPPNFGYLKQTEATFPNGLPKVPRPYQVLPRTDVDAKANENRVVGQYDQAHGNSTQSILAEIAESRLKNIVSLDDAQSHEVVAALKQPRIAVSGQTSIVVQPEDALAPPRPVMVSVRGAEELRFWATSLGVTTQELFDAIKAVGIKPIVQVDAAPNKGTW